MYTCTCTLGSMGKFSRANVPPGSYVLRIEARDLSTGEKNVMPTAIELDANEEHCTTYLINRGLRVEDRTLIVEFTSTGLFSGFTCILNGQSSQCTYVLFCQVYIILYTCTCSSSMCIYRFCLDINMCSLVVCFKMIKKSIWQAETKK